MKYWAEILFDVLKKVNPGVKGFALHPNSVYIVYYTDLTEQAFFPEAEESRTDFVLNIITKVMNRKVDDAPIVIVPNYDELIEAERAEFQQNHVAKYSKTREVENG